MINILHGLVGFAAIVALVYLTFYLCLLPSRLFLTKETWLTEEEFRQAAPEKTWIVRLLIPIGLAVVQTFLFALVALAMTAQNNVAVVLAVVFLPLFLFWVYLPVGLLEVFGGVSLLIPIGRKAGPIMFVASPHASKAGAVRLAITAMVIAAILAYAYA